MADDAGGGDSAYNWILWFLRKLVQWGSFALAGCGTLLVFWFHWGNKYKEYGVKVYDATTAGACYTAIAAAAAAAGGTTASRVAGAKVACATGAKSTQAVAAGLASQCPADDAQCGCTTAACRTTKCTYADWMCAGGTCQGTNIAGSKQYCGLDQTTWCRVKCTGPCAVDQAADATREPIASNNGYDCGPMSDNNKDWRDIFTFKPNKFLDMFTPIALGGIEFLQHVGPEYAQPMISGTWVVRAIWLFVVSLFAQFGYAGDLGVLLGYLVDFAVVLPCVAMAILDHQADEDGNSATTADLVPSLKWFLGLCGADALCPGLANVKARTVGDGGSGGGDEQASA